MTELRVESEHAVGIDALIGHDLQDVPVFDDFALSIEAEDVHSGPDVITGPILAAMKDHVVAFGDYVFEFHELAGVIACGFLEISDEAFLAVGDAGIVLDVLLACVPLDRIARAAPVEHQVVESHDVLLIALQVGHCGSLAPAKIIRERQGKAPAADGGRYKSERRAEDGVKPPLQEELRALVVGGNCDEEIGLAGNLLGFELAVEGFDDPVLEDVAVAGLYFAEDEAEA